MDSCKIKKPLIGFAGLTHLGLSTAVATAEYGFEVVGYSDDVMFIEQLRICEINILEPRLSELLNKHKKSIRFSDDSKVLAKCDIVYIAMDVPTDDKGVSSLFSIKKMINLATESMHSEALLVILCQVPPGFTRQIRWPEKQLYYQVETLVFGRAIERAMYPERFILGCANPEEGLDRKYLNYLRAFECPLLLMSYESAELAKISINMFLVAAISTANTLAEICEHIGASWGEIMPALRLDKRIGQYAYLKPGLGIAGGNLERDLSTVLNYAKKHQTDGGIVTAFVNNSILRKNWAWSTLNDLVLKKMIHPKIAVLGLTYKENTHSIKNSPSVYLLNRIKGYSVSVFDPVVEAGIVKGGNITWEINAITATERADVLLVMTPWAEFSSITAEKLEKTMMGKVVIDPYQVLLGKDLVDKGFIYATLGEPVQQPIMIT